MDVNKKNDSEIKKAIGQRVKEIRGGLSQSAFASKLQVSQPSISEIEQGKGLPSADFLLSVKLSFNVNIDWLLTGEGDPNLYKEGAGGALDEAPDVAKLMEMTREILKSGTEYAYSLALNVRSFHNSVQIQKEVGDLKERMNRFEEREKAKEAKIRTQDPPEQKEELLRKRAM